MRLNFWQWLGLILLIGAGGYWIYDKTAGRGAADQPQTQTEPAVVPPTTLPADPATAPATP